MGRGGAVYSPTFVSYFSRFLLNWEPGTVRWWEQQNAIATTFDYAVDDDSIIGILGNERVELYLGKQFASLVKSVEVSLEGFDEKRNATRLAQTLYQRYTAPAQKRALAQLLSLLGPDDQPVALIAALIGEVDNAKVVSISLDNEGRVYGVTPPAVEIAKPPTGAGRLARAKAVMRPTGRWRAVRLLDGGSGFSSDEASDAPIITIPPPYATNGTRPLVVPTIRNGSIVSVTLADGGSGYLTPEVIGGILNASSPPLIISIFQPPIASSASPHAAMAASATASSTATTTPAPPARAQRAVRAARAELIPEYEVSAIELIDAGSGYNADEPPAVTIAPPPLPEDRSSLRKGDPFLGGTAARARVRLTPRNGTLGPVELKALTQRLANAAERGPLEAYKYVGPATPSAEDLAAVGLPLPQLLPPALTPQRDATPSDKAGDKAGRSAGVLSLPFALPVRVPSGAFGRSAAAPVVQKVPLRADSALKIFLAGGLCSACAHTALVPIDVLKTRMQAEPEVYSSGPLAAARTLLDNEGPSAFVQGAGATAAGYLVAGSLSFGLLEVFSRVATSFAGPGNALFFSTPLLALSSVGATALCACAVCPFEAVRILSVRTGESSADVLRAQLEGEGFASLYRGLPPILLKEVPFVVTKFVVCALPPPHTPICPGPLSQCL